jgi:hypothetical protein
VTFVTEDERDAAAYAADIEAARDRLIAFASGCSEAQWRAAPLDGDPRPVAVVVDHVADSYEYLAGFIRQILAGQAAEVTGELVDDLNAEHAAAAAAVSQADAAEHLRRSGAAISALIASLSADELAALRPDRHPACGQSPHRYRDGPGRPGPASRLTPTTRA